LHLDLDGAWNRNALPFDSLDAREWGPRLRFSAPRRLIEKFYDEFAAHLDGKPCPYEKVSRLVMA